MSGQNIGFGAALVTEVREEAHAGRAVFARHERQAWVVAFISLGVMAGELAGGVWLNSLALQSDGLHSGTHAGVLFIAAGAYVVARRRGQDPRRAARTLDIAALINGALLAVAGLGIGIEAVERLISPEPVRFGEAAAITAVGLVFSGVSAVLLRGGHEHAHHGAPGEHMPGRDLNLWAAYLHMFADVATSVLALAALLLGVVTGWARLDAAVGILNSVVVAGFSLRLLRAAWTALARR